jgi:hypothetical protein
MNPIRTPLIAALLGLALACSATPASAQSYKPQPSMQGNWLRDLIGGSPQAQVRSVELETPTTKVDPGLDRQQLLKDLNRRQAVCDRLREIAWETDNTILAAEVERLDRLAFDVYQARSSKATSRGGSRPAAPPAARPAATPPASSPTTASAEGKR